MFHKKINIRYINKRNDILPQRKSKIKTAVLPEREDHGQGFVVNITFSEPFFRGWNGHAAACGRRRCQRSAAHGAHSPLAWEFQVCPCHLISSLFILFTLVPAAQGVATQLPGPFPWTAAIATPTAICDTTTWSSMYLPYSFYLFMAQVQGMQRNYSRRNTGIGRPQRTPRTFIHFLHSDYTFCLHLLSRPYTCVYTRTVHQGRPGESRVIKVSDDLYFVVWLFFSTYASRSHI